MLIDLFSNLAIWADRVRSGALSPNTEYAIEVELVVRGGRVHVSDFGSFVFATYNTPDIQLGSTKFFTFALEDSSDILDLLGLFYRDTWHLFRKDIGADKPVIEIEGW